MLQNLVREALEFHKNPDVDGKSLLDPSVSVNGVVDRVLLDPHGSMRFRQRKKNVYAWIGGSPTSIPGHV